MIPQDLVRLYKEYALRVGLAESGSLRGNTVSTAVQLNSVLKERGLTLDDFLKTHGLAGFTRAYDIVAKHADVRTQLREIVEEVLTALEAYRVVGL